MIARSFCETFSLTSVPVSGNNDIICKPRRMCVSVASAMLAIRAAPSIITGTMRLNEGAKMNVAYVRDQLEWFQSEDLVGKDITLDTLIDTSFVEAVGA